MRYVVALVAAVILAFIVSPADPISYCLNSVLLVM